MNNPEIENIGRAFQQADNVLIVAHTRPDGDAVGAVLGLGLALQGHGKTVQMVLQDGIPHALRHLEGSQQVIKFSSDTPDLVVVLDCSDLTRVGQVMSQFPDVPDVNIDHHITNLNFARMNLIDPKEVSTTAVLARFLPVWGYSITPPVAAALLTGIVSDTIGFRTPNVSSETMRLAADLIDNGANLADLYNQALVRKSFPAALYWGAGLSRLQRKGRLVWTSLTLADRDSAAYPGNDDADLVNILSSISDSDVAIIFVEQKKGKVKVSWRAVPGFDISKIALKFGGGGHAAASGAEIEGRLEDIQAMVLAETEAVLNENNTTEKMVHN